MAAAASEEDSSESGSDIDLLDALQNSLELQT